MKQTLRVDLDQRPYPIYIGDNLLNKETFLPLLTGKQVLIVTNKTVAELYLSYFDFLKNTHDYHQLVIEDGEQSKNCQQWYAIHDYLIENHFHRDCTIIALGGGVVGDLTGFVAATFQRGVNLIQVPTTLLAQVDSSVGGKTAINHPRGKNLIGSFYQPNAVVIDIKTLKTLPERELGAGFAEVIKYGLLTSDTRLADIEHLLQQPDILTSPLLQDIIQQCCMIKANIVKEDTHEQGKRALLNLGHTFGHAIEAYGHYQQHLHGEAVAIGLYCAAVLSHLCGYAPQSLTNQVDRILKLAHLPRRIDHAWCEQTLLGYMMHDKKIQNNQLRLIVLKGVGDCFIDETVAKEKIIQTWRLVKEGADE